ncbi:hypothetical protein NNC19_03805 [Clostridium sp. SHJSY1]|uniref:hypothetical protein n=1 Tax=Clostridium sp. SHJSY1 TaxID=2942483 RepID=UPI0028747047|nr:hypothetical protein [Clostridium sp. SHJSY1]MDS0524792.1 hypothetical protein [Clostridium sp. SHJSY1]
MEVLSYYSMLQPPIIIKKRGNSEVKKTNLANSKISREIGEIKPDGIIVITPNGTMFSDVISFSDEDGVSGELNKLFCYRKYRSL